MDRKIFKCVNETISVKNLVYEQLKKAILTHKLEPGERITEAAVARQMEVSHTPVREALRDLAKEGLIDIIPNKGSYVASLDAKDVEEIYVLRNTLEQLAVRLSAQQEKNSKIDKLENIAIKCREALRAHKLSEYNELDSLFHLTLTKLPENKRLEYFYQTLKGQIQLIMIASLIQPERPNPQAATPDHFAIVEALRNKDTETACATLDKHIIGAMHDALEHIGSEVI